MNGQVELAPGVQLGSYVLDNVLGEGGMARVYRAHHVLLGAPAAVKVIEGRGDLGPEHAERFRREARSLFKLKHPNIVQFLEFGVAEDLYYLTVEYVEGADLAWVARRYHRLGERMPVPDVIDTIEQISSALDTIHRQGIVHRDVKPSNILLGHDGHALLTDFGLALSATDSTLGAILGSANYVSPEQALSSHNAVPQSDVYSLGVVAYELLVGRVPFEKDTALAVALQHINDPVPAPRHFRPDLDPGLEVALLRALAKQPADRYASASDFARALRQAGSPAAEEGASQPLSHHPDPIAASAVDSLPSKHPGTGTPLRQVVAEHRAPAASTYGPVAPTRIAITPRLATVLAGSALLVLTLGLAAYLLVRGPLVERGRSGLVELNSTSDGSTEEEGSLVVPVGPVDLGQPAEGNAAAADAPTPSAESGMNIASCHGYRFVSRLEPGRYAFAIWRTPVYDKPRYEHDFEAGAFATVLTELAPGDRVLVLDHETYPNCFKEARFWKVQTDSGIVGWATEWRYYYLLEP